MAGERQVQAVQRELYMFYLGVYEALLYPIKPNVTAQGSCRPR